MNISNSILRLLCYSLAILLSAVLVVSFSVLDDVFAQEAVIDTITAGNGPYAVGYNPNNGDTYVSNTGSDTVYVIDEDTNTVVDTIAVGNFPQRIAFNPDNGYLYVPNFLSDDVTVIDGDTNTVVDTIEVGAAADGVTYNSRNGDLYVVTFGSNGVSVIDGDTNTVVETISAGDGPWGLAYNPDNGYRYVANLFGNTVSVIGSIVPTANAGPDQTVNPREIVQLDGSESSDPLDSALTYRWTQTGGPEITLNDSTSENPTFTAPDVLLQRDLVFELVVTNEQGIKSEPHSVTINAVSNFEGILGSGNNLNIQAQENHGNNVGGQSGFEGTYSDSPIFHGQTTEQDSQVIS